MGWTAAIDRLADRLAIFPATDPRLLEVQRQRGAVYLADGAIDPADLTADGRFVMDEDAGALHVVLDDPMTGGIWWRRADPAAYAWGGGWWTTAGSQPIDGALLILILMAQTLNAGCRYGWSTVTQRHRAHRILAKLGFRLVYRWDDPDYLCPLEWVELDATAIPARYQPLVQRIQRLLATRR